MPIPKKGLSIEVPRDGEENKPLEKTIFLLQVMQTCYWVFALSSKVGRGTLIWYYTIMTPILLGLRYFQFKARDHHYFMFDFCYWAQILVLVAVWGYPDQPILFLMVYLLCHGVLPGAIPLYRNSLVFHSMDRFTSVYIHILPMFLFFNIRWFPQDAMAYMPGYAPAFVVAEPEWYKGCADNITGIQASPCVEGSSWQYPLLLGGGGAVGIYFSWQVLYAIIVFGISRVFGGCLSVYHNEDKLTLYRYDVRHATGFMKQLYDKVGEKKGYLIWASMGGMYSAFVCFVAFAFYVNFWADLAAVLFIFLSAVQNGGNFYIEAFAKVQQRARERALHRKKQNGEPRDIRLSDRFFLDERGQLAAVEEGGSSPTASETSSDPESLDAPHKPKSPGTCNPLLTAAAL